jgi:hypothetical protein
LKPENFKLVGVELVSVIKEREKEIKAEEMRARKEAERAKVNEGGMMGEPGMNITPEMMQRFQNMRGSQPGGQPGAPRDTAMMRRFSRMRNGQPGGQRDTAAMRQMRNMMNGQQGGVRDTSMRRRSNRQPGQQSAPGNN